MKAYLRAADNGIIFTAALKYVFCVPRNLLKWRWGNFKIWLESDVQWFGRILQLVLFLQYIFTLTAEEMANTIAHYIEDHLRYPKTRRGSYLDLGLLICVKISEFFRETQSLSLKYS